MNNLEVIRVRIEALREMCVPGSAFANALAGLEVAVNEPDTLRLGTMEIRHAMYGRILVAFKGETEGKAECLEPNPRRTI